MRVLIKHATGLIGSAIVQDLPDQESLAAGAWACEGVIHTALIHDFVDCGPPARMTGALLMRWHECARRESSR